jgi:hypothetical protein|tara:strand:- start:720 stop:1043 length:324 start_codon:yes stop_codon:yes gene_type:complete
MFDFSNIEDPSKQQLKKEMEGIPQYGFYVHGKCVAYHHKSEVRNTYMKEYLKKYRTDIETPEQRKNRKEKQKLSDAKRYKETYHLRKDAYNARRRKLYNMEKENILC